MMYRSDYRAAWEVVEEAFLDADGTIAPSDGWCKQGADISYNGIWGYHPLVVSLTRQLEAFAAAARGDDPGLLADAGHMLVDFAALALAWFGFRVSRRPADRIRTYGYYRFEVLAAFVNGLTLLALVVWIVYEAVWRLFEPVAVLGGVMLVVAVLGLAEDSADASGSY